MQQHHQLAICGGVKFKLNFINPKATAPRHTVRLFPGHSSAPPRWAMTAVTRDAPRHTRLLSM